MSSPSLSNLAPNVDAFGVAFDPAMPILGGGFDMYAPKSWIIFWQGRRRLEFDKYIHEKLALRGTFDFCAEMGDALLAAAAEGEAVDFVTLIPCVGKSGGATKKTYWLAIETMQRFKREPEFWYYWDKVLGAVNKRMPDAFECAAERAKVT